MKRRNTFPILSGRGLNPDIGQGLLRFFLAITLFFSGWPLIAQLSPVSVDVQVNTSSLNSQQYPSVAMDAAGNFTVVWESFGTDGSGYGIYGQRYASTGLPFGTEFRINTTTAQDQRMPDIAINENGDGVAVWMDEAADGSGWGVFAQRFDLAGPVGTQILVPASTIGHQKFPRVAIDRNGNFVVTWMTVALNGSSFQVLGRRFSVAGTPIGLDFAADFPSITYQGFPDVAMDPDGSFVLTWQRLGAGVTGMEIVAQRYDAAGFPVGTVVGVNTQTADNQIRPSIDMDTTGQYVIVWSSYGQDGDVEGIYGQRYLANGTPNGGEFQVSATTVSAQTYPRVSMSYGGNFTVSWASYFQDTSREGVYVQAFNGSGAKVGGEVLVNTNTPGFQQMAALVQRDPFNNLVVAWQDGLRNAAGTNDGSNYGVYIKSFVVSNVFPVEWLEFTASPYSQEAVLVRWITASEHHNDYFEVEKKTDHQDWHFIGKVASQGDSPDQQSYRFMDRTPMSETVFYRLRQVDLDGNFSYSKVAEVNFGGLPQGDFTLYPNPARDQIQVQSAILYDEPYHIQLVDLAGKVLSVKTLSPGEQLANFDLGDLAEGLYQLQILLDKEHTEVLRFIKE